MRDKFALLPRVLPFVILLTGVMIALYGGYATPSETAGLGAVLALVLIALIYSVWTPRDLEPILVSTLRESTMLMIIIGMSLLYSYVMSYLHISQSTAQWIVDMHLSRWVLLAAILLMVVVLGFFLPPVSIILMTAPIILPPLRAAGFDLIWFGVVMTIVMEMGLIHPPVGLNIFVIKNIAPDIPLRDVIWGVMPFVGLMMVAVVILCFVPGIATWFSDLVMGPAQHGRPSTGGAGWVAGAHGAGRAGPGWGGGWCVCFGVPARRGFGPGATRGVGMARSARRRGVAWVKEGLAHREFWSARAGRWRGRDAVFAGALPAHLYVSEDKGQVLARAEGVPRRQDGQAMDLPAAAAHRPHQGHRARRRPAVGRRRDRLAAGLKGFRRRASPSCRSIPIRGSATSIASWCIRRGPIASSSPTASSA